MGRLVIVDEELKDITVRVCYSCGLAIEGNYMVDDEQGVRRFRHPTCAPYNDGIKERIKRVRE